MTLITKRRLASLASASAMIATVAVAARARGGPGSEAGATGDSDVVHQRLREDRDTIPGAKYDTDNSRCTT